MGIFLLLALISFYLTLWQWYRNKRLDLAVRSASARMIGIDLDAESMLKRQRASWREKLLQSLIRTSDQFAMIGEKITFLSSNKEIDRLLVYAGHPLHLDLTKFQGLKIELALIGLVIGFLLFLLGFPLAPLLFLWLPILGYAIPIIWLRRKANQRQKEITLALPDFLDIMSVTLKAGLPLDRALSLVQSYLQGPLQEELQYFLQRLAFGFPREKGWEALLNRNRSAEFQLLIKALIQGHQLGTPVSDTFSYHADQMRRIRREKAKEAAAKAGPKISFTTTLIIIPATLLLFGGLFLLNSLSMLGDLFTNPFQF